MPIVATLQPFAVGGSAACIASFCVHPIDLAKVRLQVKMIMSLSQLVTSIFWSHRIYSYTLP